MSSKSEKDRQKQIQDRCQTLLATMLRDEDNKYCVDCDAKGPRWASWNLGIFLCIRCAGIHRNLGVHISKVKSVNLDTWTPEQVVSLQQMGNSRARAVYEANLPDNFRRPQTDSSLEAFVRAKYEQKKYIAREWVPPPIPKVNWDKELEEEAQRQRRRKKEEKLQQNRKSNSSLTEVPVPQLLPKPKGSTSPKPGRTAVEPNKSQKSATQDLLGLDTPVGNPSSLSGAAVPNNGEDIFTSFLSAPPSSAPVAAEPSEGDAGKGRTAEEESFFNQPAPSSQEKRQLTKDSILALYSTGPTPQPAAAAAAPIYGIPGGIYTQQPAPANMAFSMPPAATIPNGMMAAQPLPGGVLQVRFKRMACSAVPPNNLEQCLASPQTRSSTWG
ncbi:stromal membrane-associated protein 1 isoform X2 [Anabrus simplex]|uniref:stromal membrane-associated protein 1 isoform X2 n=1 Tax=Anabrus simplex TaxID=316456 RepID=UPI0034DD67F4